MVRNRHRNLSELGKSKDEFQDYDVVHIVDDLEDLISDLSWLD